MKLKYRKSVIATLVVSLVLVQAVVAASAVTIKPAQIEAVDFVGQADFVSDLSRGDVAQSATTLYWPSGVSIDRINHRMFITDGGNDRVLVYNLNSSNVLVDKTADFVLGQENFTATGPGLDEDSLNLNDGGLVFDEVNNRLFVSDETNSRIMVFDTATIVNGEDAIHVLGQEDFTTETNELDADSFDNESTPSYDSERNLLIVPDYGNNRVLIFDTATIVNGEDAIHVLGQPNFTTSSSGTSDLLFDIEWVGSVYDETTNRFYLTDYGSNRVLVYDLTTIANGEPAINVLGQPDFLTDDSATSVNGLNGPKGLAIDKDNQILYVSDESNDRIMMFDVTSITNGEDAVGQIGQPDFNTSGGLDPSNMTVDAGDTTGLFFDETTERLYVPERDDNRLTIWEPYTLEVDDLDGISSEIEDAAPNGGDGNGDGTPDSEQSNVASFVSAITGQYVTIALNDECELQEAGVTSEGSNAVADVAFDYPVGFAGFVAECSGDAQVEVRFFNLNNANFVARKFNPNTNAYFTVEGATVAQGALGGLQFVSASYLVADNGPLDLDALSGTISDPVGLGQQVLGAPRTGAGGTFGN